MADESPRIDASRVAATAGDMLRQVLAGGGAGSAGAITPVKASAAVVTGRPGNRMLSADFPMDQLDHSAPRGTYIDLLV